MRCTQSFVFALILASLAGCAPRIDVPTGYVKLQQPGAYDLKAVSAKGCVVALRTRPNEDAKADLAFWSQALEHQKVDLDGLRLAGREAIKTASGFEGVLFRFELGEGQGKVAYLVALFVTPHEICTVEAGGPVDMVTQDMDKLRAAMCSVRI